MSGHYSLISAFRRLDLSLSCAFFASGPQALAQSSFIIPLTKAALIRITPGHSCIPFHDNVQEIQDAPSNYAILSTKIV